VADFISELASRSGVSADQAKKGVGALLSFLKDHLPAEGFSKVEAAVPGADAMMAAAPTGEEASGGVVGAITSAVGKLFGGGGGAAALAGKLTQLGFSADQLQKFLPGVLNFLKDRLPPDVLNKISALMPTEEKVGA
jgi:uncharacterized protein (DUF2267 family)